MYKGLNNYFKFSQSRSNFVKIEHHAQSADDALIGGLRFKLKPGASYVTNRRSVSYFASGGNGYSPNGVKVMKFSIAGDQWLGPNTFRVAFQLNNNMGNNAAGFPIYVQPLNWNPAVFFRRARLICGGQIVENIGGLNRLSLMLTNILPEDDQSDIACEGFENSEVVKDAGPAQAADPRKGYRQTGYDVLGNVLIARRVMFEPMLCLFNQDKLLPLRYCPIQIELELVNSQADAVTTKSWEGHSNGANWDISGIQCKFDFVALDNSLDNEYTSHLLSGKSLPINFNTWNHTNQSTGNGKDFSAHISRAVARLKNIVLTLHKPGGVEYKQANDFHHPAPTSGQHQVLSNGHSYQVQIGSKLIPEYPVNSLSGGYMQLKKTEGRAFKMHSSWYRSREYTIGLDLGRISGAGSTGLSIKSSDLLTLNFKDCDGEGAADSVPSRVLCALNYDCVLKIVCKTDLLRNI